MSSKLEIKDPVFAAFLISRGCKLLTIEPYSPPNPKMYIFDGEVRNGPYESEFLSAMEDGVVTTWLDFKNKMDNLQVIEKYMFRCHYWRTERTGKETWHGKDVFVTSCQVIASFLLSRKLKVCTIKPSGKGNYTFVFPDQEKADSLTRELLDGEAKATWYEMKEKHKYATALRLHLCRSKEKEQEPQQLRASGTNG